MIGLGEGFLEEQICQWLATRYGQDSFMALALLGFYALAVACQCLAVSYMLHAE